MPKRTDVGTQELPGCWEGDSLTVPASYDGVGGLKLLDPGSQHAIIWVVVPKNWALVCTLYDKGDATCVVQVGMKEVLLEFAQRGS